MHSLTWLNASTPLPHPDVSLPGGLLAAGDGLSLERLTEAYSKGIFPWFNPGDPVLWWSPDPRMVLACSAFTPSHSLRKKLRQLARTDHDPRARIQIKTDTAFARVIQACAMPREGQAGTWISSEIQAAYLAWHKAGSVHSVETWIDGELMGGLYGVSLGRFFFGESMFSLGADASKLALAYLVDFLLAHGVQHIDCQQETGHLHSLGARAVKRDDFLTWLEQALTQPPPPWIRGRLSQLGALAPC